MELRFTPVSFFFKTESMQFYLRPEFSCVRIPKPLFGHARQVVSAGPSAVRLSCPTFAKILARTEHKLNYKMLNNTRSRTRSPAQRNPDKSFDKRAAPNLTLETFRQPCPDFELDNSTRYRPDNRAQPKLVMRLTCKRSSPTTRAGNKKSTAKRSPKKSYNQHVHQRGSCERESAERRTRSARRSARTKLTKTHKHKFPNITEPLAKRTENESPRAIPKPHGNANPRERGSQKESLQLLHKQADRVCIRP